MKLLFKVLALLGTSMVLAFQQQPATYTVRVAEVQIPATVRDNLGRIVTNLTRDDFILEEEGKIREIESFATQADLALTMGLLVDSSMSQRQVLQEERKASLQFFKQILRPEKDLAFVISFNVEAELMQDLTHDLQQLDRSLQEVSLPGTQPPNRTRSGRGGRGGGGVGTVLYDAAFLAADEILRHQTGRKAIIMVSDGVDMGSIESLESAIEAVQRADTVIYSIRYYDEKAYGSPGGRSIGFPPGRRGGSRGPGMGRTPPDGKQILKKLSDETGGRLFEVSKKLPLADIFGQIQEELRSQYIIGYAPPEGDSGAGFRRISLRTRDKKLKVYCRAGYYPQ